MQHKKIALIIGASSDIGIALCDYYLKNNYKLYVHSNMGGSLFSEKILSNKNVSSFSVNFNDADAIAYHIENKKNIFESIDIVVNLAASLTPKVFLEICEKDIIDAIRINFIPAFLFIKAVIPGMIRRNWGRIVNASSIGVKYNGGTTSYCYSLTKHMLEFIPGLYRQWAEHNILYNVVRVGVTNTKFHLQDPYKDMIDRINRIPMKRMAKPDEIAKFIYGLGSHENSYITGECMSISGGE